MELTPNTPTSGHSGVNAIVIASQSGSFGGTIAPSGRVETKLFVACDPDRVRSVTVEAQ